MISYIARFFKFLLPILGRAAMQVAADELTRHAYPERRKRVSPSRAMREPSEKAVHTVETNGVSHKYHDVIMVAFDLEGSNIEDVHNWLMDQMPETGTHGDAGEIYLDSWWVANDERFDRSDCDSAVFVTKGAQVEARELLHAEGLSQEVVQREQM